MAIKRLITIKYLNRLTALIYIYMDDLGRKQITVYTYKYKNFPLADRNQRY